jgi:putative methyltransferase
MTQTKTVSFVQVNFQLGPKEFNSFHLPYSVGCIWAYAISQTDIVQHYQLNKFVWRRENIDVVAEQLSKDSVVGFSTYIWNLQYNLHLAKKIKELNPECCIIFGGPEPAITDALIFEKHPYIDVIIKHEGEVVFTEILRNLQNIDSVPGVIWNNNKKAVDTGVSERITELSQLPSPYITGIFDRLIEKNPDVKWAATLETNRGCPYACTFCDWGSLTLSKVKKFLEEKVFQELEWMSKNKIDFVHIADANFGIFPNRDRAIVEKFIELQKQYLAPTGIVASFAKNQNKEVIDIVELLVKETLHPAAGLRISLQSLNDNTLDAIKRKNLKINNISEILEIGRQRNIPIGTELILGLPKETLTSWEDNFWKLLELGIHEDIDVYYCQMIENAELNLVQKEIYDIKTAKIYDYFSPLAFENVGSAAESIEVVRSTADMCFDDIIKASIVSWNIFTWHVGGYSNLVTMFLHKHQGIPFKQLYQELFALAEQQPWYQQLRQQQVEILTDWFDQGRCTLDSGIPNVKLYGNTIIFHTRMLLSCNSELANKWYQLLEEFLSKYNLEPKLLDNLLDLQKNQVVTLANRTSYPLTRNYQYNIWDYINCIQTQLQPISTTVSFEFPEPETSDTEFIERIFWSRKRRFGKTWISQI